MLSCRISSICMINSWICSAFMFAFKWTFNFALSFIPHELHRLKRRHMTLCDVKTLHGSLESAWTFLTLGCHWSLSAVCTKTECWLCYLLVNCKFKANFLTNYWRNEYKCKYEMSLIFGGSGGPKWSLVKFTWARRGSFSLHATHYGSYRHGPSKMKVIH